MKCEACQSVIEEYFDGELTAPMAAEVSAHLAGCAACAAALAELEQEQEIYVRYERDIEVTPALWAGIESRIKAEKAPLPVPASPSRLREWLAGLFSAPHISPAFAVALVVIAVGATIAVMSYLNSRKINDGGNPTIAVVPSPGTNNSNTATSSAPNSNGAQNEVATSNPNKPGEEKPKVKEQKPAPQKQLVATNQKPQAQPDPMKLVREAEQKYLAAIAILSKDVSHHRSQIDPAVLARFDSALSDIDRTIQETRQVVRRNPDDPVALQYLLSAYAKKVDTLRAMALD